ncbi:MAG TPA: NrfD/PsrC family molybdoenzyme membrane anchor subunit [Kofleriaceae bacterium]|nr:NrfD/PsrC family molybdoenzyme membrane anchor subunit [Kofleriaceae bacterium]
MNPPARGDGRNLDRRLVDERGEGATFEVSEPDAAWPVAPDATPEVGPDAGPDAGPDGATATPSDTYYDLPVVKAAPWKGFIPAYFYLGGLAGAAATLAAAAELAGDHARARDLHWIAALGDAAGAVCLVADLGRPSRFHYMMRVFRPTSPMNLGTWILSGAAFTGGLALLRSLRGRRGPGVVGVASAVTGSMLSTYTGVLVGNTAIPVWASTRRRLPVWFAASSAASLASLLEVVRGSAPRPYSVLAKAAEVVTTVAVERAAATAGVDRPLRTGRSGRMWRGAKWLGLASLAATVLRRPRLAGVLGTAAALLGRFAIVDAGQASAADPRATFEPQRRAAARRA